MEFRQACFAEELVRHGVKAPETFVYPVRFKAFDAATLDRICADHPKLTALVISVAHFRQLYPTEAEHLKRFSLLAFGESDYTRNIPGLSLLREPRHQIGSRAAELIFEPPQNAGSTAIYLPGELSIGKSCRSPEPTERK